MKEKTTLLFVYNADDGIFNELKDFGKKIVKKETYQCKLCGITFGLTGMKREWKQFVKKLDYQTTFIHRDTFYEQYNCKDSLPAIFIKRENELIQLISKDEIDSCNSLDELIYLVNKKIEEYESKQEQILY